MSHRSLQRTTGFTLVELIISLIVISILAIVSMYVYNQVLERAHDDKRDDDMIILQNELEKYFERHQEYPAGCPSASCTDKLLTDNTSSPQMLNAAATINDIVGVLPGVTPALGDPRATGATGPLMDINTPTKSYFYYGGTVNTTTAASLSFGNTASFPCTIQSSLATGEAGSYVVGYYSETLNQWVLRGGKNGTPMTVTSGSASNGCVINKS